MDVTCVIWMSLVLYGCHLCYRDVSCVIWMSLVLYGCHLCYMDVSCVIWMSLVLYGCHLCYRAVDTDRTLLPLLLTVTCCHLLSCLIQHRFQLNLLQVGCLLPFFVNPHVCVTSHCPSIVMLSDGKSRNTYTYLLLLLAAPT